VKKVMDYLLEKLDRYVEKNKEYYSNCFKTR
jgi:hypothetical protein